MSAGRPRKVATGRAAALPAHDPFGAGAARLAEIEAANAKRTAQAERRENARRRIAGVPFDPSAVQIESGVPLPGARMNTGTKYEALFGQMGVGDSFAAPVEYRDTISHARRKWEKTRGKGTEFIVRRYSETECRCWRIK